MPGVESLTDRSQRLAQQDRPFRLRLQVALDWGVQAAEVAQVGDVERVGQLVVHSHLAIGQRQIVTCSRWPTSELIVPSASPAEARASTNPASTSVSNCANSSGLAGDRRSRRSRTTARLNPQPRLQSCSHILDLFEISSQKLKLSQNDR